MNLNDEIKNSILEELYKLGWPDIQTQTTQTKETEKNISIKNIEFGVGLSNTPISPNSKGIKGDIKWDGGYLYVCVSDNNWIRKEML